MKGNIEAYKLWAPHGAQWTEWVKPVLFANVPLFHFEHLEVPELRWVSQCEKSTAIIVDLPGVVGAQEGMALANLGWRPIPLYNGVSGPKHFSSVDVNQIADVLCAFAYQIPKLNLRPDAPPAFLLDANRMKGRSHPGLYDNRWCVFPQDMPSAAYLAGKGIRNVIVRAEKIQDDLAHVLRRYQEHGIAIFENNGFHQKPVTVHKPSRFKNMLYRFCVVMGLRRNSAGGFGGLIPEPSSSGSGYG